MVSRVFSFKFTAVDSPVVFVVKSSNFVEDVIDFVFESRSSIPCVIRISGNEFASILLVLYDVDLRKHCRYVLVVSFHSWWVAVNIDFQGPYFNDHLECEFEGKLGQCWLHCRIPSNTRLNGVVNPFFSKNEQKIKIDSFPKCNNLERLQCCNGWFGD